MTPRVGMLPRRRVGVAAALLARAFDEDPILTFFLDDPRRRRIAYPAFFAGLVAGHLGYGHVYQAEQDQRLVGVAVWRPPDPSRSGRIGRAATFAGETVVRALFPRQSRDLYEGFATSESTHLSEPHWYLFFVGVDVGRQGRGVGAALLHPVLERADSEGLPCALDTPFERTHAFYRRLGFEVIAEARPFAGAPPLWTLARQASGRGSSPKPA